MCVPTEIYIFSDDLIFFFSLYYCAIMGFVNTNKLKNVFLSVVNQSANISSPQKSEMILTYQKLELIFNSSSN